MSTPLDILTVLKPHFPPSGQVLAQGARINEERWREVATQTGDVDERKRLVRRLLRLHVDGEVAIAADP